MLEKTDFYYCFYSIVLGPTYFPLEYSNFVGIILCVRFRFKRALSAKCRSFYLVGWLHAQCGFSHFLLPIEQSFIDEIFRIFACRVKFLGFLCGSKKFFFIFGRDFLKLKNFEKNCQKKFFPSLGFFIFYSPVFFLVSGDFPENFAKQTFFSSSRKSFEMWNSREWNISIVKIFLQEFFMGPLGFFPIQKGS